MRPSAVRVSVVLATKDRYDTLFDCVDGLLVNYGRDDVQIIVRDNSAQPREADFRRRFGTFRNVVYIADARPVSQSENYELALEAATGDYVTMIGDDDGIAWGLLELADAMDRYGVDAFYPGFSVYLWPGVSERFAATNDSGSLTYDSKPAPLRVVDAGAQRARVLAGGCTSLEELPRLYYGLVRRRCLDLVRRQAGCCFPGPSPDMANAFALSYHVSTLVVTSLPLFIAGNSRQSNAGLGLRGRHVGEIESLPFLPRDTARHWNPDIPYFWSGQTIWCQSACTAAQAMGQREEFDRRNAFSRLYARLVVFQPQYLQRTRSAMRHRQRRATLPRRVGQTAQVAALVLQIGLTRALGFLQRRLSSRSGHSVERTRVQGLHSVSVAMREVDAYMRALQFPTWLDTALREAGLARTSTAVARPTPAEGSL